MPVAAEAAEVVATVVAGATEVQYMHLLTESGP